MSSADDSSSVGAPPRRLSARERTALTLSALIKERGSEIDRGMTKGYDSSLRKVAHKSGSFIGDSLNNIEVTREGKTGVKKSIDYKGIRKVF